MTRETPRDSFGYPMLLRSRVGNVTTYHCWRQLWVRLKVRHYGN